MKYVWNLTKARSIKLSRISEFAVKPGGLFTWTVVAYVGDDEEAIVLAEFPLRQAAQDYIDAITV